MTKTEIVQRQKVEKVTKDVEHQVEITKDIKVYREMARQQILNEMKAEIGKKKAKKESEVPQEKQTGPPQVPINS